MIRSRAHTLMLGLCAASVAGGCGGGDQDRNSGGLCRQVEQALPSGQAPRLLLSPELMQRLRDRAKANDPAWSELSSKCEQLSTSTVHPPSGPAYGPKTTTIASGYQGDGYLDPVLSLALCYRTLAGTNDAKANQYAAAGAKVLEAMSTPQSQGGAKPSTDHGYGIRNYGVGIALGYDWLRPALSASTKQKAISTLADWIGWYDDEGFINDHPIANYFIGYLLAKTFGSLAIEGDDPKGAVWFADVSTRLWAQIVKPKYAAYMKGGGWPEGWGYGPRAVRGVAEFFWAVKTAKNLNWATELDQVADQADYVSHFAWPALNRMDDQGTVRSGIALAPSALLTTSLATALWHIGSPEAPIATSFAADVIQTAPDDRAEWQKFLYWDPTLPKSSYKARTPSYLASGPGHASMRSSWDADAVWGAFSGGRYINAPDSGEQMFNAGGLSVVVGGEPLLVNPTGWIPHTANTAGEDFVYQDSWGGGGRRLYNTFFVNDASNPYNPGQNTADPATSKAALDRYEDGGAYVRVRGTGLEDQYGASGSHPVQSFDRDLVFVRPASFVIHDRTTVTSASADRWLAFHVAKSPSSASTAGPGMRRYDIAGSSGALGSLVSVLPENVTPASVALPGGTTRIELHAPSSGAAQSWLNVVRANAEPSNPKRLSASDGSVLSGAMHGVELHDATDQVVLFAIDPAAPPSSVSYRVAPLAEAEHVLVDVAPSPTGYSVTTQPSAGGFTVSVAPGGPFDPSADGVLHFTLSASGQPEAPSVPPPPPPSGSGGSGGSGGTAGSSGASGGSGAVPIPCSERSPCVDDTEPSAPGSGHDGRPYPLNLGGC